MTSANMVECCAAHGTGRHHILRPFSDHDLARSSRGLRNKSLSFVSVAGNHGPKQQCDSNIFQVHVQPKMPWIAPENNVQFNLRLGITVRRCSIFECLNIFHCLFFVCSGSNKLFGWQWLFVKVTDDRIGTCRNWSAKPPKAFSDALARFPVGNRVVVKINDNPLLNV